MRIAWSCYEEMACTTARGLPDPECISIGLIVTLIITISFIAFMINLIKLSIHKRKESKEDDTK